MRSRIVHLFLAVLMVSIATTAWAALPDQPVETRVTAPHGFPLFYTDSAGLSLELCLDEGWCFFDPVDPTDANQVALGVGGEVFWWMAEAAAPVTGVDGNAILVLALEGTFGGDEAVVNGNQISFGRVRVRVDVPVPGTYTVIHPFTSDDPAHPTNPPLVFENVTVADGINFTADIGAANFLNPALGFRGALQSDVGPFLTWPGYQNDETLQVSEPVLDELGNPVLDEQGNPVTQVVAQYVGNLDIPHVVEGSPFNTNFFRVIGPDGEVVAETDLFGVMGKVYGGQDVTAHPYPDPPLPNLAAVGPINRLTDFGANTTAASAEPLFADGAFVTDGTTTGYPFGYPIWYEDGTGLRLTICQGGNPMCISDPVNAADPAQQQFATGGETFWWSADAFIDEDSPADDPTLEGNLPPGLDASLVLGVEGTFGGGEAIIDGQQISFGRVRIRVDTPVAGDYTIVYPYGARTFTNVPAGTRAINFTGDIGIVDPADPDFAFVGTLFSEIGPNYLVWDTFLPSPAAADPLSLDPALVKQEPAVNAQGQPVTDVDGNPVMNTVYYVGDPAVPHTVTGAVFEYEGEPVNYFRIIGPDGIDVRTGQFVITGRLFDPATFRVIPVATVPVANADAATTIGTTPVDIDVLANDTLAGAPIVPAEAMVALVANAASGNAVLTGNTFTYTANQGFTGTDSFTYTVTVGGETSAEATVTVTVQAPEAVDVSRAQLDLRKLRWDIRGSGNETAEGRTLTVRVGSETGTVLGTTTVSAGSWRLKAASTTAPPTGTVVIYAESDTGNVFGPFNVQVR